MIVMLAIPAYIYAQGVVEVYTYDNDGSYTNIRSAPSGRVVYKIPTSESVEMSVTSPRNGWWKIVGGSYFDIDQNDRIMSGSSSGYWIHYTCIGAETRNYGGQKLYLRATPSSRGRVTYSFTDGIILRPIDVKGNWVKVKTEDGRHQGWISKDWLCASIFTTCG